MNTKSLLPFFGALFCSLLAFSHPAAAQTKMSKEDAKINKKIQATWSIETLQKGSRLIDFKKIAGESFMHFYPFKKKDKSGKQIVINKFKMEMQGSDRIFDYTIKGDSIKFISVEGWNDMRMIKRSDTELVLDQLVDGDIMRYSLKFIEQLKGKPGDDDKKKKDNNKKK